MTANWILNLNIGEGLPDLFEIRNSCHKYNAMEDTTWREMLADVMLQQGILFSNAFVPFDGAEIDEGTNIIIRDNFIITRTRSWVAPLNAIHRLKIDEKLSEEEVGEYLKSLVDFVSTSVIGLDIPFYFHVIPHTCYPNFKFVVSKLEKISCLHKSVSYLMVLKFPSPQLVNRKAESSGMTIHSH